MMHDFTRPGSGCSQLIMEAQTAGLINSEGSTRWTCKSFFSLESSWVWALGFLGTSRFLSCSAIIGQITIKRRRKETFLSGRVFLVFTLNPISFLIIQNGQRWHTTTRTTENKINHIPERSAPVVNLLLIMPVLLAWDSEVDDLTLLILAPHQKHIGEGTKCCYYQKQTFEFKLHLYLIHSLTPRSNALPESLKHLVRESFVTAQNNFSLE